MENEIKILTKWVEKSEIAFKEKYSAIMEHKEVKTNLQMIELNEAMTAADFIKIWKKRLAKMNNGKEMPVRIIKKINNMPDFKTTHPNMLNNY